MKFALIVASLALVVVVPRALAQDDELIDQWTDRAETCRRRGQWKRAATYLKKILACEPDDEELALELEVCLEATGDDDERERLLETWLPKCREGLRREWTLRYAAYLRRRGRDDDALAVLDGYVTKAGHDYLVESRIGEIHRDHGRDAEAKRVFDGLIDRAKGEVVRDAPSLVGLARAYTFYRYGGDAAERALVEAQKRDPDFLPAYALLGEVYGTLKVRPSDMAREFKDALEKRRNWPQFLVGLARAADLRLGQAEGAKHEAVERALRIDARLPDALYFRGMAALGDALWDKARDQFEAALSVNPNHRDCLSGLAALAYVTHDLDEWKRLEARVLALDPTFGRLHRIVAQGLSDRRRWHESLAFMRKAVAVDPTDPVLFDDLARYALYVGEEEEGMKALERAVELDTYGRVWRNNMFTVMDLLARRYETVQGEHLVYKFHKDEKRVLRRYVPRFLERSWAEFAERYGFQPKGPILWEVLRRHEDFSVRTMGTSGLGALGVCFGSTVFMDSPNARDPGTYNWAGTAHHELAHVFTLQLSGGRVPRWLTEGLSSWEEVRRNPAWGRNMEIQLHDALMNDKLLRVMEFDAAFHGPLIGFAYFQGGLASQWLEETYGLEKIRTMLRLYGRDLQTPAVLKQALGITPEAFDEGFKKFVQNLLRDVKRVPNWDDDMIARFRRNIAEGRDVEQSRLKLGWAWFRRGKFYDADEAIKPLVDAGADLVGLHLLRGASAARQKRTDLAREHYEKAYAGGSRDYDMLRWLARDAERTEDFSRAKRLYAEAAGSNPFEANPKRSPELALARLLRGEGDVEGAVQHIERYVRLVETAVDLRKELLEYHASRGHSDRVETLLRELVEVVPFDAALHVQRGDHFAASKRSEEAIDEYECVLDLKPAKDVEVTTRVKLGRLLLALDRIEDAIYHLERVLEIDPANSEARALLERATKAPGERGR